VRRRRVPGKEGGRRRGGRLSGREGEREVEEGEEEEKRGKEEKKEMEKERRLSTLSPPSHSLL